MKRVFAIEIRNANPKYPRTNMGFVVNEDIAMDVLKGMTDRGIEASLVEVPPSDGIKLVEPDEIWNWELFLVHNRRFLPRFEVIEVLGNHVETVRFYECDPFPHMDNLPKGHVYSVIINY